MLKRYLLFIGEDYYPSGGWRDFSDSFEFISTAQEAAPSDDSFMWHHIVDSTTGEILADDAVDPPGEDVDAQMEAHAELESSPPPNPERIAELRGKLDAVKPEPQGLNAATVARAFEVMLPSHEDALILKHNPHLHTDMRTFMRHAGKLLFFTSSTEQQKCEATNELWALHYTSKENAHLRLAAATLPAIAQWLEDNGLAFGN